MSWRACLECRRWLPGAPRGADVGSFRIGRSALGLLAARRLPFVPETGGALSANVCDSRPELPL